MRILTVFVCLAGAVAIALVSAAPAEAWGGGGTVSCGDTITRSIKLKEDLNCTGDGLTIGADYVTLDLGGHTISGEPLIGNGVYVAKRGVTIKNGRIEGFFQGVEAEGARYLKLSNLIFAGQVDGSFENVAVYQSQKVVIQHSTFVRSDEDGDGDPHPLAIAVVESEDVDVNNVDASGYVQAVNFINNDDAQGRIRNSALHDNTVAIWIDGSSNININRNHISTGYVGIAICGANVCDAATSEIRVNKNFIHGFDRVGVYMFGAGTDSTISYNQIHHNGDFGIRLEEEVTGNRVLSNITFSNGVDLFHDTSSTPNIWRGNSWETCEGSDIPGCPLP